MSYGGSGELTQSDGSGELTQSDECYERYSTRPTRPHQKQLKSVVRGTNGPIPSLPDEGQCRDVCVTPMTQETF